MDETKPKSERQLLAERLASFVSDNDLTQVYGGMAALASDKRSYDFGFSHRANLDGYVRVFSPKFIQVAFTTRYTNLPNQASLVFESEENAVKFITLAFIDFHGEDAMEVPQKASKKAHP